MKLIVPSFLTLVIVIAVARLMGMLFQKMKQPPVMGEVLGGIILGPSVLGYFFPDLSSMVLNKEANVFLKSIAELGIMLYLFCMGLEMDLPRLRRSAKSAIVISNISVVFPFALGLLLASQIYTTYAPAGIGLFEFSLFVGVSLSITAFPVLARILSDNAVLNRSKLGDLALSCAAIDDITAWCLVAVLTGMMQSTWSAAVWTVVLTFAYILLMFIVLRPLIIKVIQRFESKSEALSEGALAFLLFGALASAAVTEVIGIHALFGAFLFGAVIPHESSVAREFTHRVQDFVRILFLPAFFALTGTKTHVGLLNTSQDWLICGGIILLAILGKFGGTFLAARISGHDKRDSATLGILMNTRGLVELIVLNIGLSIGVLTPALFTMLVIMALVTTFMTGPLLSWNLKKT